MKTPKNFTKIFSAAVMTSMVLQGCAAGTSPQAASLAPVNGSRDQNSDASETDVFLDADAEAQAQAAIRVSSTTTGERIEGLEDPGLRRRFAKVNFALLKKLLLGPVAPTTLKLNLFADEPVTIAISSVEIESADNFVVTGSIVGDEDSSATLVMNGDALVATIKRGTSDQSYEVRYAGGGLHSIRIPDPAKETEEGCETAEVPAEDQDEEPLIGSGDLTAQATPVIDILVAYTPKARSAAGGTTAIKATIQEGIADTNAAFTNSGVNLQVRLVGTMETKSSETGSWSSDLSYLKSKSDSKWNDVHTERARLGADQVSLVGSYSGSGTAGIGYVRATSSSAFTITKRTAFSQYSFTHELGHNIGLEHDDGYVNSSGRFRTIMAYGSYTRIRRFSNPDKTYNGYRTGSSSRDSVSIIKSRASIIPAFYSTKVLTASVPLMDPSGLK